VPGRLLAPEPSTAPAEVLSTGLLSLHNLIVSRQLTLEDADGRQRRRSFADVQELYKRSISDFSALDLPAPEQAAVTRVVSRLEQVVKAYDPLLERNPSSAERAAARRAVDRLRATVRALTKEGYEVVDG
jgi:hypothetical protein